MANSGWILVDRLGRAAIGLFITSAIARHLGPTGFGWLSYALSIAALMQILGTLGLESIVQARLAHRSQQESAEIIASAVALRLLGVLITVAVVLMAAVGGILDQPLVYAGAALFILLLPFEIVEALLHGQLESRRVVKGRGAAFGLATLFRIWALTQEPSAELFLLIAAGEALLSSVMVMTRVPSQIWNPFHAKLEVMGGLFRQALPMLLIVTSGVAALRLDVILLKHWQDVSWAGVYSVSGRLLELLLILPVALGTSALTVLARDWKNDESTFEKRSTELYAHVALASWILATGLSLAARPVVEILFGPQFELAVQVFQCTVWSLPFLFTGHIRNTLWLAQGRIGAWAVLSGLSLLATLIIYALVIPSLLQMEEIPRLALAFVAAQILGNGLFSFLFWRDGVRQWKGLLLFPFWWGKIFDRRTS